MERALEYNNVSNGDGDMEKTPLTTQQEEILKYKALIDFYEKHPTAPVSVLNNQYIWIAGTPNDYKAIGAGRKEYNDSTFVYNVEILPSNDPDREWDSFSLKFITNRENVCKKISKGKKIVPEHIEQGTPTRIIAEHEEDDFEWECPESILAPAEE
jgi:hypothetical protein